MSIRMLDGSNDWEFGKSFSNYATESNEIALNVKTRILSFYRDCFFDLEAGIDYFSLLDYNNQSKLEMAIEDTIITTDGVSQLQQLNLYIGTDRKMSIEYSILDIYSNEVMDNILLENDI